MAESLATLAKLVGGDVCGDGETVISGAAPLRDAAAGEITLIDKIENARQLAGCPAAAVVTPRVFIPQSLPAVAVDDIHAAFITILAHFRPPRPTARTGISPAAHIGQRVQLGRDVDVHAGAVIGDNVYIGDGSTIHSTACIMAGSQLGRGVTVFPAAVVYENTVIGDRVIIHAAAVIGSYGFGYQTVDGRHRLSAQLGHVEIENDVEVGACTTIDRGTYGRTLVGEGTKIDNQVMIAHNCRIGRHNMLCSQVGIAGSTTTGDYVVMAGQVGVRDHVHVGARSILCAKAGVRNDVPEDVTMIGIPATPERKQKLLLASLSKLPEMRKRLRALERQIEDLLGNHPADDQAA